MTMLLAQVFILLLGAFLFGAALACLVRRSIFGDARTIAAVPAVAGAVGAAAPVATRTQEADRFGRALAGGDVPPVFQSSKVPVVEVQPLPQATATVPPAAPVVLAAKPVEIAEEPSEAEVATEPLWKGATATVAQPEPELAPELPTESEPRPVVKAAPAPSLQQDFTSAAVAAATAAAAAAAAAASPALSAVAGPVDDLMRIRAIDADTQRRLYALGVGRYADIAAWKPADVTRVSQSLGVYGRIEQENWIEQAQILSKGHETEYSRRREPAEAAAVLAEVPAIGGHLHRIIGINPQTEQMLASAGITQLSQIAGWGTADVASIEALLGKPGRVAAENWIDQAKFLTRGTQSASVPVEALPPRPTRSEALAGLRSVRSEALRGDGAGLGQIDAQGVDDLKRIRGVGILIEKKLNSLGVTSYEQVANWTGEDIDRVSQVLDFKGRIERENWVEQARILASGGHTEFSRRADRGEV
ncbi:MAG: hypothetical protein WC807_01125 [Hyphomicrobium sp.]|jgi:predicted flap endonuclease-1-like 5' DNA nuclease